jgi:PAS domain S-box-containing protein
LADPDLNTVGVAVLRALADVSAIVFDRRLAVVVACGDAIGPDRLAAAECEGRVASELLAEHWELYEPLFRAALEGRSGSLEVEAANPEGRYLAIIEPLPDARGGSGAVTCIWRDVTAGTMLRIELQQQRRLLELAHDAIIVREPARSEVTYWNRAAEGIYGYSRAEVFRQVTHELLETAFPRSQKAVDDELAERGRWEGELWHTRKDGARILVSSRQALVRDDDGRPLAVIELNSDITERTHALVALREAEERFRELIESAPDAMVIVDQEANIVLVNARTEELLGYRREELIGEPVETLIPLRLRRAHVADRDRFLDDPLARPMGAGQDLRARRKDGTEFPAEISLSPVRTATGLLIAASIRDVGRQLLRKLEQALVPRMEVAQRWQVAWRSRPSVRTMLLGGDFIGVSERADGSLALLIGDVTGHGPAAAGTGALLRAAWLGAIQGDVALGSIPDMLNRLLIKQADRDATPLASVCLAEVDPAAVELRVVRAGHDSPLLITSDSVSGLGDIHGPLLGLDERGRWPVQRVRLPADAAIMLFTDGLTERRAPLGAHEIGFDALISEIDPHTLVSQPPEQAIDQVLARIFPDGTEALEDDLAVILLVLRAGAEAQANGATARTAGRNLA